MRGEAHASVFSFFFFSRVPDFGYDDLHITGPPAQCFFVFCSKGKYCCTYECMYVARLVSEFANEKEAEIQTIQYPRSTRFSLPRTPLLSYYYNTAACSTCV